MVVRRRCNRGLLSAPDSGHRPYPPDVPAPTAQFLCQRSRELPWKRTIQMLARRSTVFSTLHRVECDESMYTSDFVSVVCLANPCTRSGANSS